MHISKEHIVEVGLLLKFQEKINKGSLLYRMTSTYIYQKLSNIYIVSSLDRGQFKCVELKSSFGHN